ncbi:hypothetical protein [Methanofollis formosanus]|uniref:hypothetical protein n=1 Tax=Methanofollis formosanus TaxID=299308 RepID=UPI001C7CBB31|nr:hypothetical protein [Methanofollis formosanus]
MTLEIWFLRWTVGYAFARCASAEKVVSSIFMLATGKYMTLDRARGESVARTR